MSREMIVTTSSFHTEISRIFLVRAFCEERAGPDREPPPYPEELAINASLYLYRPSDLHLTVVLRVQSDETQPYKVDVMYAADFIMSDAVEEDEREPAWIGVAYDVAPALLYTYIRDLVSNLTTRGRGGEFILPLMPLPFDKPTEGYTLPPLGDFQAEMEFPEPEGDDAEAE